ncbi:MAG: pyridoxal phosphate-dependent aminotransferase [Puniceicoccales bacterium]|jgi:aspartate/methionine/tyrosine aminotransferase|nr:pyridoxal phosphate-dependent aminotransferase [Puniceicoccales bacterium]
MFSRRIDWNTAKNALTNAAEKRRQAGLPLADLASANPTRDGFAWAPETLASAFANAENRYYLPCPQGVAAARESIAAYYATHAAAVSASQIHLCASTSEGYAWVLKLLADPGDQVLAPAPSYPLLQFLAEMECVTIAHYPLVLQNGCWRVDAAALKAAITPRTRAIFCVSPNNPTGSTFDAQERAFLREIALQHGLVLIVDEVFIDFAAADRAPLSSWAGETEAPLLALNGLSKLALLPQIKLAWIATAGPPDWRHTALKNLDLIADTYLSTSTAAQNAAPFLLQHAPFARAPLLQRINANEQTLRDWCASSPHAPHVLPREAGWTAMLALPNGVDEEAASLDLIKRGGVIVHPGYFYDTPHGFPPCWVVSLTAPETAFAAALAAMHDTLQRH